jgi:phage tail-like protein
MDANGQRFWMWADARDYVRMDDCAYDHQRRLLVLDRERERPVEPERALRAEQRLAQLPWLRDAKGTLARWDPDARVLRGFGVFEGSVPVPGTGAAQPPNDMAIDDEQVVLLAFDSFIDLIDLRERFAPLRLESPALDGGERFVTSKIACDGQGGRWLLDRRHQRLARVAGRAWRTRAFVELAPETFRPEPENPDAPRIELIDLPLPGDRDVVVIAASRAGRVLLGAWGPDGRMFIHSLREVGGRFALDEVGELLGGAYGHALKWLDERLIAVRAGALDEALAFDADDADRPLDLIGARYPLRRALEGPLVQSQDWPPHYPCEPDVLPAEYPVIHSRPLVPLSWRALRNDGVADGRVIDGGTFGMPWHRIYVEASVPHGCGVLVELAAFDDDVDATDGDFHPHWIGDAATMPPVAPEAPRGAWVRAASEVAFHPGLLPCANESSAGGSSSERGRTGLFTVLVQRADHALRDLRGRWLHLRLHLVGNGRQSPAIAAVRIYGARFSFVRRYLPELYRDEDVFDRTRTGAATSHDFLERFVDLFESELTPWEDKAASARVLMHPSSCPADALPWLASFSGVRWPAALPEDRQRAWLASAPERARRRGTLPGLQLALDVATGGAVSNGAVVVVEDFRLRRTVATLLGVDLERDDDPLLPGLIISGNSLVGDTLILGDETVERDFLAAFLPDALSDEEVSAEEAERIVESFYERTAFRATVLVHEALDEAMQRRIDAIVAEEAPAHVEVKVMAAGAPLLVGITALVGVDTYLREPLAVRVARINVSRIGRGDVIEGGAAFDWRLESGWAPAVNLPVAVLDGPEVVNVASNFTLSGERSTAAEGRSLTRYTWSRRPSG